MRLAVLIRRPELQILRRMLLQGDGYAHNISPIDTHTRLELDTESPRATGPVRRARQHVDRREHRVLRCKADAWHWRGGRREAEF